MLKFKLLIFVFCVISVTANAQLVNDMQRSEKRTDILRAYKENRVLLIIGRKYSVEDINYFYFDRSKTEENSQYRWASQGGFKVGIDSVNLSDVKIKNLKTGDVAILRYPELFKYDIELKKRKVRRK